MLWCVCKSRCLSLLGDQQCRSHLWNESRADESFRRRLRTPLYTAVQCARSGSLSADSAAVAPWVASPCAVYLTAYITSQCQSAWRTARRGTSPSSSETSASSTQSSPTSESGSTARCARWKTRWRGSGRNSWTERATSSRPRRGETRLAVCTSKSCRLG